MNQFEDTSRTVLHEGKFLRFVNKGGWEYVERNNCEGIVIILAMTDEHKIIFVEQYRPPVESNVIEFPAGLINDSRDLKPLRKKESLLEAAQRELREETGYVAENMRSVFTGPINSGISSDMLVFVRAEGLRKVSCGGGDEWEDIQVHEVDRDHANLWLSRKQEEGCLIGPRIYAGLYFLNKYNR